LPRFKKGQGGRPKGAKNKTTIAAKEAIALAADKLGGVDRLVAWAKEDPANERVFWGSVYPRLLPVQAEVSGPNGDAIPIRQIVNNYVTQPPDAPTR
jgi:hypothetical protein